MPITLAFDGNFYELSDFLFRLRTLVGVRAGELRAAGRLFAVESISFAESSKGFPELGATLSIVAYVYGTDVSGQCGRTTGGDDAAGRSECSDTGTRAGRRTYWSGGESLMAKRVDPLAAKKAKQKKVAIGLCVLLAAVVAFQGPKMLKMMKGPAATAEAAPATPAPTTPGTVPDPAAPAPACRRSRQCSRTPTSRRTRRAGS